MTETSKIGKKEVDIQIQEAPPKKKQYHKPKKSRLTKT